LRSDHAWRILSDNPMISQPKKRSKIGSEPISVNRAGKRKAGGKIGSGAINPKSGPVRRPGPAQSRSASGPIDSKPKLGAEPILFERLLQHPAYWRVSAVIEEKILRRALRPGDPLPTETELARQFGVNRSTVREALRRLESSGLVSRVNGGKRLLVTRPAPAETASRVSRALALDEVTFIELWEAMLAIAPRTAALAAERARPEGSALLDDVVLRVESARSADAAVAIVVEFFGLLAELAGNRVLVLSTQPLTRLLAPSLRRMIDRVPQAQSRIVVAERCIAEAVRRGRPEEAQTWMTRHIQDFRRGYELAGMSLDTRVALPS
jgi:GntR family transcriptional repressor for pyruvate dehydrogenase complex